MNSSSADEPPARDQSLAEPFSHKGLTYPHRQGPAVGELIMLDEGVGWARLPMPGVLNHINVWALDDRDEQGEGVALVDTGVNTAGCREAWDALFAGPLAGRRVTRVFVTHFHPDHIGLAGWLCERFGVALWMTRTEWLMARMLYADARVTAPPEAIAAFRFAGWDEDRIKREADKGWARFSMMLSAPPAGFRRIVDGDVIPIGDRRWRVVVGTGHAPEHGCLVDESGAFVISGDQILPRITSNVSVGVNEPEGDPLGDWLASIDRMLALPEGALVLPAHGEPFYGVRTRLEVLRDGHLEGLAKLHALIAEPRRAVDCFGALFRRTIDDPVFAMASGETMAHLRRLEESGRARREVRDGVGWFSAV